MQLEAEFFKKLLTTLFKNVVGSDKSRPSLCQLLVEFDKDTNSATFAATDAHKLVKVKAYCSGAWVEPTHTSGGIPADAREFVIKSGNFKLAIAKLETFPKKQLVSLVDFVRDNGEFGAREFPSWRAIVPQALKAAYTSQKPYQIDGRLLGDAIAVFTDLAQKRPTGSAAMTMFHSGSELDPLVLKTPEHLTSLLSYEILAVIMPMRA
jgi:hypothetical protein